MTTSVALIICAIVIVWRFGGEFRVIDWALFLAFSVLFAATPIGTSVHTAVTDIVGGISQLASHL